ncbi:chaplin family protein [Spirillospora sp. NBC_01491]|uniref:chaplin family protein n=1 Tax=Spirillospora sp. NBC_01491 TaxID=2976007 RepID=UPI002E30E407|nr:chaplin family protein [Spirillospora sp. NBC_01491]
MRTWAKNTGRAALLAAGFVAIGAGFGSGIATADTTNGDGSILGGNQIEAPISVPVNATGNGVGVLGAGEGKGKGSATVTNIKKGGGKKKTSGRGSILGGNQIEAPISVPVNACGNGVAVAGTAKGKCKGSATVTNIKKGGGHHSGGHKGGHKPGAHKPRGHHSGGRQSGGWETSGDGSILGGNQIYLPISVPINLCGNGIAVLGAAKGECEGNATVKNVTGEKGKPRHRHHHLPSTLRKSTAGAPAKSRDLPASDSSKAVADLLRSLGVELPETQNAPAKQSAPAGQNAPADKGQATNPTRTMTDLVKSAGLPGADGQKSAGPRAQAPLIKGVPVNVPGTPNNR